MGDTTYSFTGTSTASCVFDSGGIDTIISLYNGLQLINLPAVGYNFVDTEPVGWVDSVWTDEGVDLTLRSIGGNQAANGQTTSVHWAR